MLVRVRTDRRLLTGQLGAFTEGEPGCACRIWEVGDDDAERYIKDY